MLGTQPECPWLGLGQEPDVRQPHPPVPLTVQTLHLQHSPQSPYVVQEEAVRARTDPRPAATDAEADTLHLPSGSFLILPDRLRLLYEAVLDSLCVNLRAGCIFPVSGQSRPITVLQQGDRRRSQSFLSLFVPVLALLLVGQFAKLLTADSTVLPAQHPNQQLQIDILQSNLGSANRRRQSQFMLNLHRVMNQPEKSQLARAKKYGLCAEEAKIYFPSEECYRSIDEVKLKHRTNLALTDWAKEQLHSQGTTTRLLNDCPDEIARVPYSKLTVGQFVEKYEAANLPLIIEGLPATWDSEPGFWQFNGLLSRLAEVKFKVGEDDDGYKLRVKLQHFIEYMASNKDDSPLYLFESNLEGNKQMQRVIQNFKVPPYFRDDLFSHAGEKARPPYRWLLIGPERSGTTVHIDPLLTSAWNCSLQGYKRWVLFPPHLPKSLVKGYQFFQKGCSPEAITYFAEILPKLIEKQGRKSLGIVQFIQRPNDTVFVPGGWWHAVLNCTDTLAVTQNFMSKTNTQTVWRSVRAERPKFADRLRRKLKESVPQVHEQINRFEEAIQASSERLSKKYFSTSSSSSSSSSSSQEVSFQQKQSNTGERRSLSTEVKGRDRSRGRKLSKQV